MISPDVGNGLDAARLRVMLDALATADPDLRSAIARVHGRSIIHKARIFVKVERRRLRCIKITIQISRVRRYCCIVCCINAW